MDDDYLWVWIVLGLVVVVGVGVLLWFFWERLFPSKPREYAYYDLPHVELKVICINKDENSAVLVDGRGRKCILVCANKFVARAGEKIPAEGRRVVARRFAH